MRRFAGGVALGVATVGVVFLSFAYQRWSTRPLPSDAKRHEAFVSEAHNARPTVILLGDSVLDGWRAHPESWEALAGRLRAVNFGVAGDRIENVLWRGLNGELESPGVEVVVLMPGSDHLAHTPVAAADYDGLMRNLASRLAYQHPAIKFVTIGAIPGITHSAGECNAVALHGGECEPKFVDVSASFLDASGKPNAALFDGHQLNAAGYDVLGSVIASKVSPLITDVAANHHGERRG